MKWAVVVFPGSNCDEDAASAVERVLGDDVQLVWHQQSDLSRYDAIILPGGFSYGDYLRSGAIARFSQAMASVAEAAQQGKLVLGICNGFQVLTEAGLLPGALLRNDHLQFRCELTELIVENVDTPFTNQYTVGERILVPVAHGEGRYFASDDAIQALTDARQIAFRYSNNPNGSIKDIAGIVNQRRNVLGMMPHPERAVSDWMRSEDGARVFLAMKHWFNQHSGESAETGEATLIG
jgi:phosphoribosylformylglycinamidine synthase I